ncbi:hypothetical protein GBAR_LOCUS19586 [Geodia barretti]|uniref:Uncharacterized protein n=1 Tax=Geodia barretti TaxID=519541 RepID=A0AA35WZY4_GEOBA|nr:hypothetical protein GBAR_LOCUS19586 [Geodia barretti]
MGGTSFMSISELWTSLLWGDLLWGDGVDLVVLTNFTHYDRGNGLRNTLQ